MCFFNFEFHILKNLCCITCAFRDELCEIMPQGILPNISTHSETVAQSPNQIEAGTITSTTRAHVAAQDLIRGIAQTTVDILSDRISQTDKMYREEIIGTRTTLQHILNSDDSKSYSSFIIEVFNECCDSNSIAAVTAAIACLNLKLQEFVAVSPHSQQDVPKDDPYILEYLTNCQRALRTFHSVVRPEDLPDDLHIHHLKIQNIDKLLTSWIKKPFSLGKEFTITCHSLSQKTCDVQTLFYIHC